MNPTQAQLDARMNPTAFNVYTPAEGLFKDIGGYGSNVYKQNTDRKYSSFNSNDLHKRKLTA